MKIIDRLINFVFSLIMLVLSLVVLLVIFNFIDRDYINGLINDYVWNENCKLIVALTSCVIFLAGLKTTIFLSDFKKRRKIPIMVNSENGSVQIAQETVESTAKAVALTHEEVKEANVKMVNRSKGVEIYMSVLFVQDTNIREVTTQIQEEVKEKVKETTGVVVLNTDIKVKNVVEKNKRTMSDSVLKEEQKSKESLEHNNNLNENTQEATSEVETQDVQIENNQTENE